MLDKIINLIEEYRPAVTEPEAIDNVLLADKIRDLFPRWKEGFPKIVCLCGSTRFYKEFMKAGYEEELKGNIVLTVNFSPDLEDHEHGGCAAITEEEKKRVDELHKRKIDLADEVFVLNVDNYIGSSTRSEIEYAINHNKPIRYLLPRLPENQEGNNG